MNALECDEKNSFLKDLKAFEFSHLKRLFCVHLCFNSICLYKADNASILIIIQSKENQKLF